MEKYLEIADDVLGAIVQTEEWTRIQTEDPQILKAKAAFERALESVKPFITAEMLDKLEKAAIHYSISYIDSAILYGIQVSEAIRCAANDPPALSRHILARINRRTTA